MKATVVTTFKDAISGKVYCVGDEYSLENVQQERIDLLTQPHPRTNKIYLFVEDESKQDNKTPPVVKKEKPKTTRKRTQSEPSNEGE